MRLKLGHCPNLRDSPPKVFLKDEIGIGSLIMWVFPFIVSIESKRNSSNLIEMDSEVKQSLCRMLKVNLMSDARLLIGWKWTNLV